ncbi:MAG: SusE domain-containing protein, partial [Prevotella sp.]|nr:SusE domain-containing protein [Prevotella sp.]
MKKILKSTLLLLCSVCLFTACEDDNDSNPTLVIPTTFHLNTPAYAQANTDLASSTELPFTWSQPNYGGFPVAAQYQMQFSLKNSFTTSVAQAEADESGKTIADYVMLDQIYNSCQGTVNASSLAKGLEQLAGWDEDNVPETVTVYARLTSDFANDTIYSNVVSFLVSPY